MKRRILDMDMSKKICVIFTVIFLISMTLSYGVTYHAYVRTIEKTAEGLMEQAAETMAVSLDHTVETAKLITIAPLCSTRLQDAFRSNGNLIVRQQEGRFFLTFLNSMPLSDHAVGFYAKDGTLIFSRFPNFCYSLFQEYYDEWKAISVSYGGSAIVVAMDEESGYSCAVLRSVIDTECFENIGLASVCVSKFDFNQAFERICSIPGGRAIVVDSLKQVVYDSDELLQNCSVEGDGVISFLSKQTGRYNVSLDGENYVGVNVAQASGQYQIIIYSVQRELMAEMRSTQRAILLLVICVCMVTFMLIRFMSQKLTVPLKKITSLMRCVQDGDFSVRFKSKTEDEVGVLGKNFNLLLERLNQQINDIVCISNKKKQLEIDILKSQINPHFMYNTLETIHMMAIEADQPEIEEISKAFGRLMRYNITSMNEVTTMRQELAFLKDYLYIQNMRFHNRFRLEIYVDPFLMDSYLLKMLLQPMVENAIIHGFEPRSRGGIIRLCASHCAKGQVITILDDGIGMSEETLKQIQNSLEDGASHKGKDSIGLKNVNSRIKLYYGVQYGLTLYSIEAKGTMVEIMIPVIGGDNDSDSIGG